MEIKLIDETSRYRYELLRGNGKEHFSTEKEVRTFYVHQGSVVLSDLRSSDRCIEDKLLQTGEGFIVVPGTTYTLNSSNDLIALQTSSNASGDIYEIVDDGVNKNEVKINGHKIITKPKRVLKPWGHELWISWLRDYHVLKQIGMFTEKKSSLQLHREKLETNYLIEGIADVIDGYPMDLSLSEEEMKEKAKVLNWDNYKKRMTPGMFWTNKPGIVHRVVSVSDYIAYETSTPELDDVIRLSDDSGRHSGRITAEHIQKKD